MWKLLVVLLLLCLTAGGLWPVDAQQVDPAGNNVVSAEDYKAGEILVKLKEGVSTLSAERVLQQYTATLVDSLYGSEVELWQVPEGSELETVEQLNDDPNIEYAEPNYRIYALDIVPDDPSFGRQWAHPIIHSPAAWGITTGSTAMTIAILDSGIDPEHPDLWSKILAGYDFVEDDNTPTDENGHGTHVAGIAAAATNNGVGVAGMDWNARIMPVRVLDRVGGGYTSDLVAGIDWAYQHGAKVLNLSLGGPFESPAMQDAINRAHAAGTLVVAAMGNKSSNTPVYPAALANVLAVAATGPTDDRAYYSNYGSHCDVAAPGGAMSGLHDPSGIYSTMPTYDVYMTEEHGYSTNYDYVQGTSQAAPYVSGLAALLWALEPDLTPDQVQNTIETSAVDKGAPGWDPYYGHGRIDALAALGVYIPPAAPLLSPISNPDGDGTYLVDWNNVPSATSYELQEDDSPSFPWPPTKSYSVTNSQISITGRQGGTWYYRVRARNDAGNSLWSNVVGVTVRPGAPDLIAIDNASEEDEYQVTWSPASGASGYTLEEDDSDVFTSPAIRYQGPAIGYKVTGQRNGTWWYRVRAYNVAGDGPWSTTERTTVNVAALPAPVLEPIDNADEDGDFLVRWNAVASATDYRLEKSRESYFSAPIVEYSGPATQKQVVDQLAGTWYYRVRVWPSPKSPWSNTQSVYVAGVYLPLVGRNYH